MMASHLAFPTLDPAAADSDALPKSSAKFSRPMLFSMFVVELTLKVFHMNFATPSKPITSLSSAASDQQRLFQLRSKEGKARQNVC